MPDPLMPVLKYWCVSCGWYVDLTHGPRCPGDCTRVMRRRRTWLCPVPDCEESGWLSKAGLVAHTAEAHDLAAAKAGR